MANCYDSDNDVNKSSTEFNFSKFGSNYKIKDLTFSKAENNNDLITNILDFEEVKLSVLQAQKGVFEILFNNKPCKIRSKDLQLQKEVKISKETNILKL